MLLLLFVSFVLCAKEKCGNYHHTKFYDEHKLNKDDYFVSSTYDDKDPCIMISNEEFRKLYPQFSKGNDVEHIVDTANSEYGCEKSIMGNLVMANSIWNRQIGNMCWDDVKVEKREIYGEIFDRAVDNVRRCCKTETINFFSIMIITIIVFVALIGLIVYIYYKID